MRQHVEFSKGPRPTGKSTSPALGDVALTAEDLVVHRGAAVVLDGLQLALMRREVVAVQGPSGSGKSTLLATLAGLLRPASGSVWLSGARVDDSSDRSRARVRLRQLGLVFQGDEFLPELTLGENMTLPLRLAGRGSRSADYEPVLAPLMQRLGIAGLQQRRPSEVSGGQLQRAAVARAVIHQPSVILADEPTGSLDPVSSRAAMQLLVELARETGSAVLVVTHDDAAARWCDRSVVLRHGRLAPAERADAPAHVG